MAELETQGVRDFANSIAWHGYLGKPEWMNRVHDGYLDVDMNWTEGGPDYTEPNYATNAADWERHLPKSSATVVDRSPVGISPWMKRAGRI